MCGIHHTREPLRPAVAWIRDAGSVRTASEGLSATRCILKYVSQYTSAEDVRWRILRQPLPKRPDMQCNVSPLKSTDDTMQIYGMSCDEAVETWLYKSRTNILKTSSYHYKLSSPKIHDGELRLAALLCCGCWACLSSSQCWPTAFEVSTRTSNYPDHWQPASGMCVPQILNMMLMSRS